MWPELHKQDRFYRSKSQNRILSSCELVGQVNGQRKDRGTWERDLTKNVRVN